MIIERYNKNIGCLITEQDQLILQSKTVGVIGAGGNGGYIIEFLTRLGINKLIIFDGDSFSKSNLNRQIYCTEQTLGQNKANIAKERCSEINSSLIVHALSKYCDEQDIDLLSHCDIIFYEADPYINVGLLRETLRKLIIAYNIPVIDGGVLDFGSELSIVTKNDLSLFDSFTKKYIKQSKETPEQLVMSQPAYLCALQAALKVNAMVQYLCGKKYAPYDELFTFDCIHGKINRSDRFGKIN